jgi:hypothetical protein
MSVAPCFTSALGFAMPLGFPTTADELQAHGMHRSDARLKFAAAALRASRAKTWPRLLKRFGHVPTAIALPAPAHPLDPADFGPEYAAAVDALIAARNGPAPAGLPAAVWALTSRSLLTWLARPDQVCAEALAVLTLMLQASAESAIARMDAACWYSISLHPEWRAAGRAFIEPYRDTWLADWLMLRPEYCALATVAREEFPDVPTYLSGDQN